MRRRLQCPLLARSLVLALSLGLAALAACRIEDRTPTGSRRDEEAVRSLLAEYYRNVSALNWPAVRAAFAENAQVVARPDGPGSPWRTYADPAAWTAELALATQGLAPGEPGVRMARTDFRQESGVAAVWVTTRLAERVNGRVHEGGRVEHFVLHRVGGRWEIEHLVSIPDPALR